MVFGDPPNCPDPSRYEWITIPATPQVSFGTLMNYLGTTGRIKVDDKLYSLCPGDSVYTDGMRHGGPRQCNGIQVC